MKKCALILMGVIGINHLSGAQRVGIGTMQPTAMLSIDSGLVIDQGDHNKGVLNPSALSFGGDAKTGILNNRTPGSVLRSGLSFITGGFRRVIIDSVGNIGIGVSSHPDYRLNVSGTTFTSSLVVNANTSIGGQLSVNSQNTTALVYLKGIAGTPGDWGQHIILENRTTADYGAILYDINGMKFRNFNASNGFYFRNSANTNSMYINATGDVSAAGTVSVQGGKGIVRSSNATQLKTVLITIPLPSANLAPGGYQQVNFTFEAFSEIPNVSLAQISTESSKRLVYTLHNVSTTGGTLTVFNTTADYVAPIGGIIKATVIGAE